MTDQLAEKRDLRADSADTAKKAAQGGSLLSAACAALMIALELFTLAGAAAWALGGLLHLGTGLQIGLYAAFMLPTIFMAVAFARGAFRAEADWQRQ